MGNSFLFYSVYSYEITKHEKKWIKREIQTKRNYINFVHTE